MNLKLLLIGMCCVFITVPTQAQLLKKLKQKAGEAAERTLLRKTDEVVTKKTEKTIDDATTPKGKSKEENENGENQDEELSESSNSALNIHTEAKKAFFKEDVVIKIHENGNHNQTQYFDADQVAVRLDQATEPKPGYIDSEGFMYGYNEREGMYNKSSLVALQSQGMMVPTMLIEGYKLPPEPFMANLQKQQDLGVTANPFNGIVEFAFVYEPEHFRYEDFKEVKRNIKGKSYTKFEFLNEPGYEGSYVLFDDKDRLVEIYTNKTKTSQPTNGFQMDMMPPGESQFVYDYKPVDVKLPPAIEKKAAGQDMMAMVFGSFKKDKNPEDIDEDDYDTSNSKGQVKSVRNAINNHKVSAADLPNTYEFDWIYETEMLIGDKKKDKIGMNFLIKKGVTYQATQMVDEKSKDMGNMTMLFDTDLNTMVMFTDGQGQKFIQTYPIPEVKNKSEKVDFKISELSPKEILNFNCNGLQMEDDRYIIKVYHTSEAPITLNNFMNFGGAKNMEIPDIDPRVLSQFSNGLIMEMHMEDKKKSKNNMVITAKNLTKQPTIIKPKDYQSMNLFSGAGMLKN
ncbi:hypothetical protein ACGK9U_13015 [Mariniflexile sp. HNIBRBA6329]|uniref:hypothetical protein n=1 Tax=Mariniflexile sp. HNIBRBA6329 TaxID=3373088 RepID=UPI0037469699